MMVGVPVWFWVWVCACWPFVWVMGVVVGVFGVWWCCFQWCVAVVWASRRVPGVLWFGWCCCGVGGLVWACSGAGVAWLWVPVCSGVCVVGLVLWFRMLMRVAVSFCVFVLLSWFCCLGFVCLFVWLCVCLFC